MGDRSDEDLQEMGDEPNIDLDMEDSDRFFFTKELLQKMLKKGADRSDEDLQEISDEPNIDLDMEDSDRFFFTKELLQKMLKKGAADLMKTFKRFWMSPTLTWIWKILIDS